MGKPIAILVMQAEATVISANKYTIQLADLTRTTTGSGGAGGLRRGLVRSLGVGLLGRGLR